MKFIRKPFILRTVVVFFIINFLTSAFLPMYSYALTGGPHQIEYTSYEEPGATDMVNLLTGDFTYNLPIIEVPGSEGSFSLPLSYHAGIGTDQEASWVGLGWSMNAGAITRNINAYPDDANGESQSVNVQDMNVIKGWAANNGMVRMGWNNRDGHYGSVNLHSIVQVNWHNGISSAGLIGVTVGGGDVNFDAATFVSGVSTIVTFGAASVAGSVGTAAIELAKSSAIEAAISSTLSFAMGASTPSASTNGYWQQSRSEEKRFLHKNYWIWLNQTRTEDMHGVLHLGKADYSLFNEEYFYVFIKNKGSDQSMYRFNHTSNSTKGSASDINYLIDKDNYHENFNPALLAFDDYNVNASGVSGSISPYRLDIGSVGTPREMTSRHVRLAPVKYMDYKVPFMYEGAPSNAYFHHIGGQNSVSSLTPYYGMNYSLKSCFNQNGESPENDGYKGFQVNYNFNDVILKDERIRTDINLTNKIPTANHIEWVSNKEIKDNPVYSSKFLDFLPGGAGTTTPRYEFRSAFTLGSVVPNTYYYNTTDFSSYMPVSQDVYNKININDPIALEATFYDNSASPEYGENAQYVEITNLKVYSKTYTPATGKYFIQASSGTTSQPLNTAVFTPYNGSIGDVTLLYYKTPQMEQGIGGYVITAVDGTSYHFALPIYDYDLKTEIVDANDPAKKSIINRKAPFANTWLLTAITYADFIDRNNNGLADEGDWGGWIKLNYGKASDEYKYRTPFADNSFRNDYSNKTRTYSQGTKQLYYLNSIETRSHVALFMKSPRLDGKSKNNVVPYKLDEVAVISKSVYGDLLLNGVPNYSNSISNLCVSSAFASSTVRNLINRNSVKRVLFNTNYTLCKGAPNFTTNPTNPNENGKLTLGSISIMARGDDQNKKILPDYKFEYGFNPNYDQHRWDAWGLYTPNGAQSGATHQPSLSDQDATAWSLKKIITPLGSEVEINYERDRYGSISENIVNSSYTSSTDFTLTDGVVNSFIANANFSEGDRVRVGVTENFYCSPDPTAICDDPQSGQVVPCDNIYVGAEIAFKWGRIQGSQIILDAPINYTLGTSACPYGGPGYEYELGGVTIQKIEKKGGNLRVGSIVVKDEFGIQNKIRYLYEKSDGTGSSGVIAKQNPYVSNTTYNLDKKPEYPDTPVLYGTVSVLTGKLSDDFDYVNKEVYKFETPQSGLVQHMSINVVPTHLACEAGIGIVYEYMTWNQQIIRNYTAKIGKLISIQNVDKNNIEISSSILNYTHNDQDPSYQGIYSQGTLLFERILSQDGKHRYSKASRTTGLRYPYVLKGVTSTKDGLISKVENKKWDFITGKVLEKVETSPLGLRVKTVEQPAYTKYSAMGSKALNINNKNMLNQTAATYSYLVDTNDNTLGLIGASVQTWKSDWNNYRILNAGVYGEGPEGDGVWRKDASYTWKGDYSRLRSDGTQTVLAGDQYNFTSGATNAGWQYLGKTLRYDHYSMPLEGEDLKGFLSTTKLGYDQRVPILSAVNAGYNEVAFSSAEDLNTTTNYFGGEVSLKGGGAGNATVVKRSTGGVSHTGESALSLSSGSGFVYKPTGLTTNKTYRVSVWMNSTQGRIYYKLNGGATQLSVAPTIVTQAGSWYLVNLNIAIGSTFTSLEVGVQSANGTTVVFDDFRFQPADAVMTCYVHNPLDYKHTTDMTYSEYVLDNDNFYSRYLYNEKGQLYRVYKESIKYRGEKLISESNIDYRRFHINQ